MMKVKEEKT